MVADRIAWTKSFLDRPPTKSYERRDALCLLFRSCSRNLEGTLFYEYLHPTSTVSHGFFGLGQASRGLCECVSRVMASQPDGDNSGGIPARNGHRVCRQSGVPKGSDLRSLGSTRRAQAQAISARN